MDIKPATIALGATMLALSAGAGGAGTDITVASIAMGRLYVLGQTERPNTPVNLEDKFNTTSNEKGVFQFEQIYFPQRCIVKIIVEERQYEAVVSNCGQAYTVCEPCSNQTQDAAAAHDIVTPSIKETTTQIDQSDRYTLDKLRKILDNNRMQALEDKVKTVNSLPRAEPADVPLPPTRPVVVSPDAVQDGSDRASTAAPPVSETVRQSAQIATLRDARSAEPHKPSLIDLNAASLDELNSLKGGGTIGRIIVKNRPYQTVDQLLTKRVLKQATYQAVKTQVEVRSGPPSSPTRRR